MIDVDNVLTSIIITLNRANIGSIFIKDFNLHDKPSYPYTTVNVTTPYISQTFRPNIEQRFNTQKDKVVYTRKEQPQMTLSFNIFADSRASAYNVAANTISCLKFICYDDLASKDIVVLEVSNIRNLTGILVNEYEHRFQFDLRIRVNSEVEKDVDYAKQITITNKNNDEDIIIKE